MVTFLEERLEWRPNARNAAPKSYAERDHNLGERERQAKSGRGSSGGFSLGGGYSGAGCESVGGGRIGGRTLALQATGHRGYTPSMED